MIYTLAVLALAGWALFLRTAAACLYFMHCTVELGRDHPDPCVRAAAREAVKAWDIAVESWPVLRRVIEWEAAR